MHYSGEIQVWSGEGGKYIGSNIYTIQKTHFSKPSIALHIGSFSLKKLPVTGTAADCQSAQTSELWDERRWIWHPPLLENLLKPQISVWGCSCWASALCFDSSVCNELLSYLPSMLISQIRMQCCRVKQLQV